MTKKPKQQRQKNLAARTVPAQKRVPTGKQLQRIDRIIGGVLLELSKE